MTTMNTNRIAALLTIFIATVFSSGCAVDTSDSQDSAMSVVADSALRSPGRFDLFRGNDGQWYFHLKSSNGQIILQSEGYVAKAGAENGIESVKNNAIDLSNFVLSEASNGQWFFNLRAKNYQIIGTSELYASKSNAKRGSLAVNRVVTKILRLEAADNGGAAFELFEGKDGQFYFHLEAANHEIVLQSEGYVTKTGALNGIETVRANGKDVDNYVIKEAVNGQWYFVLVAGNGEVIGVSEMYVSKYNAKRGAETVADLLYSERVADAE